MANAINVAFDIDQPAATVEISTDSGATWAALTVPASGTHKTGNLLGVAAATYAAGAIKLRAVGYPASVVSNAASVVVASIPAISERTGLGDSQFDAQWEGQALLNRFPAPANRVGRFTYPNQGIQYLLDQFNNPFQGASGSNGIAFANWHQSSRGSIVDIYICTNDLVLNGRTASYCFAKMQELITAVRALGHQLVQVYTITSLRRDNDSSTIAAIETERLAFNTLLRGKASGAARFDSGADSVIDIGATAELGQRDSALSTYWFNSTTQGINLHWKNGVDIVSEMGLAGEQRLIAGDRGFMITTHTQVQPGAGGGTTYTAVAMAATATTGFDIATAGQVHDTVGNGNSITAATQGIVGAGSWEMTLKAASRGIVVGFGPSRPASYVGQSPYLISREPTNSTAFQVLRYGAFVGGDASHYYYFTENDKLYPVLTVNGSGNLDIHLELNGTTLAGSLVTDAFTGTTAVNYPYLNGTRLGGGLDDFGMKSPNAFGSTGL